jgi:hypothetical protein
MGSPQPPIFTMRVPPGTGLKPPAGWEGRFVPDSNLGKFYRTKRRGPYRGADPDCREDYTVQTKTVMERSHAPLTHWAVAFHMTGIVQEGLLRAPASSRT